VNTERFADEFVVRGIIDGRPTAARWVDNHLVADPELVRRAQVVVGMGEVFTVADDPRYVIEAALDRGTMTALLTVMRAFTVITSVELPIRL